MEIIRLDDYEKNAPLFLALGNFDGVHLGHQRLISAAVKAAREAGGRSGVLIFDPHPLKVVAPALAPRMLVDSRRKYELIEALGVDAVIVAEFNAEVARCTPEQFAGVLAGRLGVVSAHIGFNYTFGHKGLGTPQLLAELGEQCGFTVDIASPVMVDGNVVSSTLIRGCLEEGNVVLARNLLGHFPVLAGEVKHGEERGRKLGFPTANVAVASDILVPALGVYSSVVRYGPDFYPAVTNIGRKITFHDEYPVTVETHLLDFDGDLYHKRLDVFLLGRIRGESRFSGPQELAARIRADIGEARAAVMTTPFTPLYI